MYHKHLWLSAFIVLNLAFPTFAHAQEDSKLQNLMRVINLGNRIDIVENNIGKPLKVSEYSDTEEENEYNVDGCHVDIITKNKYVESIKSEFSPKCQFTLDKDFDFLKGIMNNGNLTFGDITDNNFVFDIDCFMCGNDYEPGASAYRKGPHIDNFINIKFSLDNNQDYGDQDSKDYDKYIDASDALENYLKTRLNTDLLDEDEVKKLPYWNEVAFKFFKDVGINRVEINNNVE